MQHQLLTNQAPPPMGVQYPSIGVGNLGRYIQTGVLGEGTFGVVVRARDPASEFPEQELAIKMLPRGEFVQNFRTYIKREIVHQQSLQHPFIVSLTEVFLTVTHLCIVMEYAAGGDMFKYICSHRPHCRLLESQARWIFQQLITGLDYCHLKGVANRDLKLENLLLDRNGADGSRPLLKICDFGYSKHEQNSSAKTGVGTPIYMAPEIVYGGNRYDAKKADIWSCGVILYAMLFGCYPFSNKEPGYIRKIVTATFRMPPEVKLSDGCKDLLLKLLVADSDARYTIAQIQAHEWFRKGLPPGSEEMNTYYLSEQGPTPSVDDEVGEIDSFIHTAQHLGQPGEPILTIEF
mmetsp:Transcript_11502/g.34552  ORF Transcript_11502/g.34552 Transcript_11502/m.34552 type:complete len:348 (+) Transcript_11502:371-1414(+)|eukprot:CAMPEP_0206136130 /NCGR_PEP_ID=MMETSP1473-20131121/1360_1 /ASSEMBLY_ACC=CAM_ASM_001109 /TAXON_ID=1461547 /ORGANISM="Stichococcus sp, Strain RCC1054" /LENGTH=347 /DNA_ID=CAMNT_0053528421 /DNA_START=276 /DNA_END=1319 /DNA_ORIENTATION=+